MTAPDRPIPVRPVIAGLAAALLLLTWVASGSFVMAVLVVVLVGGTLGLGALVLSWASRDPGDPLADRLPDARPTTDLHHVAAPSDKVRAALRGLLARPWVRGDGLVRAATRRLASPDALVWTPRGQQVAAPHLWVEWNTDDLADLSARWPLGVLAEELAAGYEDHLREGGVRRMSERSVLHLLAGPDVPRGRVIVTAAFSRPQRDPVVTASTTGTAQLPSAEPAHPVPQARPAPPARPVALAGPRPVPAGVAAGGRDGGSGGTRPRAPLTRLLGRRESTGGPTAATRWDGTPPPVR